jgi:hypothetical protein
MPTEISGSTGVNKIQDDTVVAADIASSVNLGKVLQVIYGTTNTTAQTGAQSYTDTGLSASITPSATSSKVLILVSQNLVFKTDTASEREVYWNICRGSSLVILASSTMDTNTSNQFKNSVFNGLNFLDSPNTTSATTYKTQMKVSAGSSDVYAQTNSTNSTMILLEIGA